VAAAALLACCSLCWESLVCGSSGIAGLLKPPQEIVDPGHLTPGWFEGDCLLIVPRGAGAAVRSSAKAAHRVQVKAQPFLSFWPVEYLPTYTGTECWFDVFAARGSSKE